MPLNPQVGRPRLAFIVIVYALSTILSLITWITGADQSPFALAAGLGAMFAPTLATLIVVSAMNAPEPTLQWDCFRFDMFQSRSC